MTRACIPRGVSYDRTKIKIFAAKGGASKGKSFLKAHYRNPPTRTVSDAGNSNNVKTVICILAGGPGGIQQTNAWKHLQASSKGGIGYAVYIDSQCPAVRHHTLPDFWLPSLSNVKKSAAWGDITLVKVELELYKWAMKKYPHAEWFLLVRHQLLLVALIRFYLKKE